MPNDNCMIVDVSWGKPFSILWLIQRNFGFELVIPEISMDLYMFDAGCCTIVSWPRLASWY